MAVIKSGSSTDLLNVDSVSKAARVTLYNSAGAELGASSATSTSTLQTTGNNSLANIDAKTPALGQALAASSQPVVLTAAQISTLTPLASVGVNNFPATQPISAAALPLPSGAATAANQQTNAITDTQLRASPVPTTASDLLTKGTQGATGFSVQPLKDAGRAIRTFTGNLFSGSTSEALTTLTPQQDGTAGSPATSFTITSGKRLVLQQFFVSTRATAASVARTTFYLRMSTTGAVTTSSAIVAILEVTGPSATILTGGQQQLTLVDGVELSGAMQFGVSRISSVATTLECVTLVGYEY